MKTIYLTSLVLLVAACSGGQTAPGDGGQTHAELKKAAAEAAASGAASNDVCGDNDWYGDGECDNFCRDSDSVDCAPDCVGGVVCAAFIEEANGYCSRTAEDPCIGQDPDCSGGSVPPSDPDYPIACPAIAELPNGVCNRDIDDPCRSQDPDCQGGGSVPGDPGMGGSIPGDPGMGGGSDPGMGDEPVACAEFIEVPDGVCARDPNDPCIFQDPDCNVK